MVFSILPKNERKQFNLIYHSSKVKFFHSFLGELKIPQRHFEIDWPLLLFPLQIKASMWDYSDFNLENTQKSIDKTSKNCWSPCSCVYRMFKITCAWNCNFFYFATKIYFIKELSKWQNVGHVCFWVCVDIFAKFSQCAKIHQDFPQFVARTESFDGKIAHCGIISFSL